MAGKETHQHTEQEDYDLHRKPRRSDNEEGEQDRKREDQQTIVPTLNLELNIDDSRTQLQSSTHQNALQSSNNTGNVFGRQANLEHQIRIGNPEKTSSSDDAAAIVLTRQDAANHSNYLQQSNEEPTDGENRDNEVEDRQLEQQPFTHREDSVSSVGPTSLPDLNIENVIDSITSDEMVGLTDLVVTDDEEHNIETRRIIAVAEVEAELLEDDRDIIEIGASAHLLVTQPPLVTNETAGETVLQSEDEIVERQMREMEQRNIEEGIIPEVLEDDRDMIEVGTNAALSLRYVSAEEQQENCVDRAVLNPNVEDIHNMVEAGTSVFEQVYATPQISNTHPSSERALNVDMETSSNVHVHVATSDEIYSASDAATPIIEGVTSTGDDAIPAPYVGDLDRGATVGLNQPRDAGDYYDPTTPIQIIAIDDYGTVGTLRYPEYDHKLELDGVPDDVRIRDMFYQLVRTYHEQPSYRTELCSLLESCQTDGLWPDIPENEDVTITANVQDYFEQFQTSLVNLCEGHLTDCREEAQSILSLLCSNRVRLSDGCLVGVLEFQNKAFGHFLAVFLSGKLASCLKLAIFRGEFFSKFKCPADLNIDGEILSLDAQQEAEQFLKMLIGRHLKVQVFIKYKQIQECISGASTELHIKISVEQNMHQPEMERHSLLNQLKVDLDINPELKAVFMLCYPEIGRITDGCVLFDKAKHTDNTLLEDEFLKCSVCSEKRCRLKMLPCQHRVCAVCMKRLEKEQTEEKKCPTCEQDLKEVVLKTAVVKCPECRKIQVSGHGFEDCRQSTFIADTINDPHYPRSGEAQQELKVINQNFKEPQIVDNFIKFQPLGVESGSDLADRDATEIVRDAFNTIASKISKQTFQNRIQVGDSVELHTSDVGVGNTANGGNGNSKEVGIVVYLNENGTVEVIFPSHPGWSGPRHDLVISAGRPKLPLVGDIVRFENAISRRHQERISGIGILTKIKSKPLEETSKDRQCDLTVWTLAGEGVSGENIPAEVMYSDISLEPSFQIGERVSVKGRENERSYEEEIVGLHVDEANSFVTVRTFGTEDKVIVVKAKEVQRDRRLRAGDYIKVVAVAGTDTVRQGNGPLCIKAEDKSGINQILVKDDEYGRALEYVGTSSDYSNEVVVELFRLPYVALIVPVQHIVRVSERQASSERQRYEEWFNDICFLDKQISPQAGASTRAEKKIKAQ